MLKKIKNLDSFGKNILLMFAGASLLNCFNLLYQLLIAHQLNPADFAAFNSLLAVFMLISVPLTTLQTSLAKFIADYKAHNQEEKIDLLLTGLIKKIVPFALATFVIFYFLSVPLFDKLKIYSIPSMFILMGMVALAWLMPISLGALQGMEKFHWYSYVSVFSGIIKLGLTFLFIALGYNIAGALGGNLISISAIVLLSYIPLKSYLFRNRTGESIHFKDFFLYLFPVALSLFIFTVLTISDMIMVKYFFSPEKAGAYSLAQMIGKICLFLPATISIVMFPRTSSLHTKNIDTVPTFKRSIFYTAYLCAAATIVYNLFPAFILKVLTGKALPESIVLGRLFTVSMSFFALLNLLISYFLSKKEFGFIKYLVIFAILQLGEIALFHGNLLQIQLILCINSIMLFMIHLRIFYKTIHEKR